MPRHAPVRPTREPLSDAGDATRAPADLVDELASELNLLSQTWTDPAAFLERRDFLVKRLRRLARRLKGAPAPASSAAAPPAEYHRARRAVLTEPRVLATRQAVKRTSAITLHLRGRP